jgi:signal transduction histidine kinase
MRRGLQLGIHQKLIGLVAVLITAIVGFLCIYFPVQQLGNLRSELIHRTNSYSALLSGQVRSAVAFADRETAREVLSSLDSDPDVAAVVLTDSRGAVMYQAGQPTPREQDTRGGGVPRVLHFKDRIAVVSPVTSLEGPTGTLVIEVSTSRTRLGMQRMISTAAAGGAVALVFGIAMAFFIARSLARRLRAIATMATAVASGATQTSVDDGSSDEIGSLAAAFDRMVEELNRVNRELDDRVKERTAELTSTKEKLVVEMEERARMELELRQASKLESVGRLASGVAHEINTPIQFVSDSCHFMRDVARDIDTVIQGYRQIVAELQAGTITAEQAGARAAEIEETSDVGYVLENLPLAVTRSIEGLDRVAAIVRAMKEFAYPERKEKAQADINRAIMTTLMVSANEYKYVADVTTELGELPTVTCHVGELNQVVLNIVVNAAHAIQDLCDKTGVRGHITIRTWTSGPDVLISIADTGKGMPPEVMEKIFDPFFTTKEVGKGTGQGLTIAHSVIVDKHGGKLTVDSEVGRGTTFTISLPVEGGRQVDEQAATDVAASVA